MSRESPLAAHRLLVIGLVALLAAVTFLFLRGPDSWQRRYHPLAYQEAIESAALRHTVNPYLVAAVINVESKWDEEVVSGAGAVGLMQVLPSTARDLERWGLVDPESFSADELADPATNIEYGTAYLRYLVNRYHEIETVLAAYNAGLGNVDRWVEEGVDIRETIQFPETRHYVLRVMRARDIYEQLYPEEFAEWRSQNR